MNKIDNSPKQKAQQAAVVVTTIAASIILFVIEGMVDAEKPHPFYRIMYMISGALLLYFLQSTMLVDFLKKKFRNN